MIELEEPSRMIATYENSNERLRSLIPVSDNLSRQTFLIHLRWQEAILQDLYKLGTQFGSQSKMPNHDSTGKAKKTQIPFGNDKQKYNQQHT